MSDCEHDGAWIYSKSRGTVCAQCDRDAVLIVGELQRPYVLTDTPPSEPGLWLFKEYPDSDIEAKYIDQIAGSDELWLRTFTSDWQVTHTRVWEFVGAKWGSAPLPLLRGEDDE